jgi:hypothetical protein
MPYHAFLSYAEEDSAFCDEVYRILSAVFDLQAYRYTERCGRSSITSPAAGDFMQQIRAVLTQKPAPALVVIASDHAVASDYVLDELEEYWAATADDAERLVVFLEIHPDAVRALGRRLALRSAMFAEENLRRFRIIEREETGALVDKERHGRGGGVAPRRSCRGRARCEPGRAPGLQRTGALPVYRRHTSRRPASRTPWSTRSPSTTAGSRSCTGVRPTCDPRASCSATAMEAREPRLLPNGAVNASARSPIMASTWCARRDSNP